MAKFVVGADSGRIYEALHAAGVFADDPSDIARVIIDLKAGSVARIYIDKFADSALTEVFLSGGIALIETGE